MTGRAGGWILGLVVILGMTAAGVVGLRPILFRKKVTILFYDSSQWTPEASAAIRLAFEERNFRGGSFRVEPEFVNESKRDGIQIEHHVPQWFVAGPRNPPSDPDKLYFFPQDFIVGHQTARWVRRLGIQRVFLLSSAGFEWGFHEEATAAGIQCRSDFLNPQGRSLVEGVLAADPELVILGYPVRPTVNALRKAGYSGKILAYDEDFDPTHYTGQQPAEMEGFLLAASFTPVPAEFIAKLKPTSKGPAGLPEYLSWRLATLALDAIERSDSDNQAAIYRVLASSPEFAADGSSTLPGALYTFRKGVLEFVEPLK